MRAFSWLVALSGVVVGAIFMSAIFWGWEEKRNPAEPPAVSTPANLDKPETRLCLGLVTMLDGAARTRSAIIVKDTAALRVAVYSVEQGYADAREAAVELGRPSLDQLSGAVQNLSTASADPTVMRQAAALNPDLTTITTEATGLSQGESCIDRLAG
ncbi:hypothetical protein AB0I28_23360 [Phytomonospora sp. NPDC050363]|uniref:hypothetical protein n=1 Tax=Phytomonospora sp. NPDC050363 TaxID=3155642 RepID=UPI0033F8927A